MTGHSLRPPGTRQCRAQEGTRGRVWAGRRGRGRRKGDEEEEVEEEEGEEEEGEEKGGLAILRLAPGQGHGMWSNTLLL